MENLLEKSKKELLEIARELKIKNYSKLSKAELINSIEELKTTENNEPLNKDFNLNIVKNIDTPPKLISKPLNIHNVYISEGYTENISYSTR
jgi:hypothetical protein